MKDYHPPLTLLTGRVILVTGASADLGRAAALTYAAHGASVVLLDRDTQPLETVYDEITSQEYPEPAILPLDLASATLEICEAAAGVIAREFGRLDGLLHAAAELGTLTPLELYDPPTWGRVLQVNLNARWLLTRACLPLLKKSDAASILFASADVGRHARAYWGAYGVAAFGNEALVQILAAELETNTSIRVNSLDPGAVQSFQRSRAYPGEDARALPRPKDIMGMYLYLMGPDSRTISGRALHAQNDLPTP